MIAGAHYPPSVTCCGSEVRLRSPVSACRSCGRVYLQNGTPLRINLADLERALFTSLGEGIVRPERDESPE